MCMAWKGKMEICKTREGADDSTASASGLAHKP